MHLFSVVIPLFNKRDYIRRAVDSVLSQAFRDFELIVIDDGSTDGSHEALEDVSDPRMTLIRQPNAGEGAARNRGIREARAEWIAFLDADDMWLPTHLDALAALIGRFPHSGLVATGCLEIPDGSQLPPLPTKHSELREIDYFTEAAANIGIVNASVAAVTRTAIRQRGGFGPFPAGADLECWAKLALDYPVAISNQVTSVYFRGTGGVMEQLGMKSAKRDFARRPTIAEISPSLKLLSGALLDGNYAARKSSIEAYINSRLLCATRGALYHRDIERARNVVGLAIGRIPPGLRVAQLGLKLPDPAIRLAMDVFTTSRDVLRSFRGQNSRVA